MKTVFVASGMSYPKNDNIINQAKQIGKLLADKGYCYIQGGSAKGLMGETLKEFSKYSQDFMLLIPEFYYEIDIKELTELFGKQLKHKVVKGEADRLKCVQECDIVIVLPGGTGTLEEFLYVNETSRADEHDSHLILVNIDGFYNNFLAQLKTNIDLGLTKKSALHFQIVDNVDDLVNLI